MNHCKHESMADPAALDASKAEHLAQHIMKRARRESGYGQRYFKRHPEQRELKARCKQIWEEGNGKT